MMPPSAITVPGDKKTKPDNLQVMEIEANIIRALKKKCSPLGAYPFLFADPSFCEHVEAILMDDSRVPGDGNVYVAWTPVGHPTYSFLCNMALAAPDVGL